MRQLRNSGISSLNEKLLESKGLKINLKKTSDGQSRHYKGWLNQKLRLTHVSNLRAKANSDLCAQCGKWTNSRCAGVKTETTN